MGLDPPNDPSQWMNRLQSLNMNDPRVPRREGDIVVSNGQWIEVIHPRPKPRTAFDREAEQHSLRFYLKDRMAKREHLIDVSLRYFGEMPAYPPRRSEDGPYSAYFRQLTAEREERLGRIEAVSADPPRPAGPDADGGREGREPEGQVRSRAHRIDGAWVKWPWSRGDWSC